jgi:hypothetical protein
MGTEFLLSLSRILEHGLNTNSYKFALARALADSELPRGELVPATWLANKFLELYWPLATEFRVRQSTDSTREPVAYKWALQLGAELRLRPGQPLSAAKAADPAAVEQLVGRLADRGGCLDEVVSRFNRVKKEAVPAPLFRPAEDQRSLILAPGANEWIASHRLPIRQLATGAWVRFTEAFSVAPRLYADRRSLLLLRPCWVRLTRSRPLRAVVVCPRGPDLESGASLRWTRWVQPEEDRRHSERIRYGASK